MSQRALKKKLIDFAAIKSPILRSEINSQLSNKRIITAKKRIAKPVEIVESKDRKREREEDSHSACLACSHNPDKVCHKDCPYYPAKVERENE